MSNGEFMVGSASKKTIQHTPTRIHIQELADTLNEFEKNNLDWLLKEELEGWNLWFSIKKSLFYYLKQKEHAEITKPFNRQRKFSLVVDSLGFIRDLVRAGAVKNADVILTDSINQFRKDEEGNYIDVFVDPLIIKGIIDKYIYLETGGNTEKTRRRRVRSIWNDSRQLPIALYAKIDSRKPARRAKAAELSQLLNQFFSENGTSLRVPKEIIAILMSTFLAQLKWYSMLWKYFRPRRLLTVDLIPDGSIAAARKLNIPVYEFQHGFLNHNKPDYIIPAHFLSCRQKMPVANFICVFGEYFRDLLLKTGFWKEEEVIVLGSYAVEHGRITRNKEPLQPGVLDILWTTQPSTYTHTTTIISEIERAAPPGVVFHLKFHPREPAANRAWYSELADRNPENFRIAPESYFFDALQNKQILISFHSTTILEALALGCPVISIATGKLARGISDMLTEDLTDVIKPVKTSDELLSIIAQCKADPHQAELWGRACAKRGEYFFASGYMENIRKHFTLDKMA